MNYRQELILNIPVKSTNIRCFCKRDDEYNYKFVADKLANFIRPILLKFNIIPIDLGFTLGEFVANAYDSYAKKGVKPGLCLTIKAVVESKNDKLIVKIKDNGNGFPDKKKGTFFSRSDIHNDNKISEAYIGGEHVGLKIVESDLAQIGGKLLCKHRNYEGAAFYLEFDLPESNHQQNML